ncbi:MAG: glycosyltransferase [Clostridia bacterium]|nr:glycosyltransferase [Clostridia bacterium]
MPDNFKISAAIVTYNDGDKAAAAVSSVIAHCKKYPLDFYIIDNNSSDDTLSRIEKLIPSENIIRLKKNIGFGAAHNKVLNVIKSRYHFVINPDITVNYDVFADMVDFFEKNPDAVMLSPCILNTDKTVQQLPKSVPDFKKLFLGRLSKKIRSEYVWADREITEPCEIDFSSGCFFSIKSEEFKKLAGFDERYFMYLEDADLTLRAKNLGKVLFLPSVKVTHIWGRGSHKDLRLLFIHIASCFKFLIKWRGYKK